MDDKRKIVLGSEDILAKGVSDIFLNINLQQTFNQIKKDKYDNNFDLSEQFRKERNESRNFRIYGIVDSTIINTDNLNIQIYKNSGLTQFVGTIKTTPLVYSEENVFAKRRGKYLLELNNYDADVVYFRVLGNNLTYGNQLFEQRLVFYTLDGEFVEYGTRTVDIGLDNPGFLEIENDFPFFYNKHWIKKNLEIVEEKPTVMQFGAESSSVAEGSSIAIDIVMDKPSPFGNESIVLNAILGTALPADFNLSIGGSPITFPITLNWSPGEQNKSIVFDAITDSVYEFSEDVRFDLYNFQFTNSGLTTSHYVTIEDTTPRKKTIYHLGEIYKNRASFTGRTTTFSTVSSYAILRNGLHFKNSNEEFYPGDTYSLVVTNSGINTILPVNTAFGVNTEQLWLAGEAKTFNLDTTYSGSEKHKVKLTFPPGPHNIGTININGVNIPLSSGALNYSAISSKILDGSPLDYLPSFGLEKDWSAVSDGAGAIIITSKTTGLPVKIDINATSSSFSFPPGLPPNPSKTPYVVELNPFVERKQVTKKLKLYANNSTNTTTSYSFQFVKPGYGGIFVPAEAHEATVVGVNRYLVTDFRYICRNWDSVTDDCIYSTAATKDVGATTITVNGDGTPNQFNYPHPVGNAYINGSVLLSSNNLPGTKFNYTSINGASFKINPLIVEPCTNSTLLPNSISQITKITIPTIGQGNPITRNLYEDNAVGFRSFDFRMGTSGPFTTFYKENAGFYTTSDISWANQINVSGATTGAVGTLSQRLDYGNIASIIPVGPVLGNDVLGNHMAEAYPATTIYLKSKTPGVPFEIINIVNAYVHTTDNIPFTGPYLFAGDTISPIAVETIIENGVAGVDINTAKNWMGGYNTNLELGPGSSSSGGTGVGLPAESLPLVGISF